MRALIDGKPIYSYSYNVLQNVFHAWKAKKGKVVHPVLLSLFLKDEGATRSEGVPYKAVRINTNRTHFRDLKFTIKRGKAIVHEGCYQQVYVRNITPETSTALIVAPETERGEDRDEHMEDQRPSPVRQSEAYGFSDMRSALERMDNRLNTMQNTVGDCYEMARNSMYASSAAWRDQDYY